MKVSCFFVCRKSKKTNQTTQVFVSPEKKHHARRNAFPHPKMGKTRRPQS